VACPGLLGLVIPGLAAGQNPESKALAAQDSKIDQFRCFMSIRFRIAAARRPE
jgi:hypothetical protein